MNLRPPMTSMAGVNARMVEQVQERLAELRRVGLEYLLAAGGLASLALAATHLRPDFVLPLAAGTVAGVAFGLRALTKRQDLIDLLASDRDAQAIPPIRAYAEQLSSRAQRRRVAAELRGLLLRAEQGELPFQCRIRACSGELRELADQLDSDLDLDPTAAVECVRLVDDGMRSPLFGAETTAADLHSRLLRLLSGFRSVGTP